MNERIRELWEESQEWNGSDDGRGRLKIIKSVEKFAELIIKDQQHEWVGLTDEEIQVIHETYYRRMGPNEFAKLVEAKLKEKNT